MAIKPPDSISAQRARRMRLAKLVFGLMIATGLAWRIASIFLG